MKNRVPRADRSVLRHALAVLAGTAVIALPMAGRAASGPTSDDFFKHDSGDWILPAGDYSGNRQLSEKEITPDNVGTLQAAWTFKIPDDSPIEAAPIVWHDTVYLTSAHDDVYAIDAKSGALKWQYNDHPDQIVGFSRNRGVAVLDGKVFVATLAGHIVALDAETGKKAWDKLEVESPKDSYFTMQPVPYSSRCPIRACC